MWFIFTVIIISINRMEILVQKNSLKLNSTFIGCFESCKKIHCGSKETGAILLLQWILSEYITYLLFLENENTSKLYQIQYVVNMIHASHKIEISIICNWFCLNQKLYWTRKPTPFLCFYLCTFANMSEWLNPLLFKSKIENIHIIPFKSYGHQIQYEVTFI
eukprot:273992_1